MARKIILTLIILAFALLNYYYDTPWKYLLLLPFFIILFYPSRKD